MNGRDPRRPAHVVRLGAFAALAVLVAAGIAYVLSPYQPFDHAGELGSQIASTATIAAFVKTFVDFIDSIGWAGWASRTAFAFAPSATYFAAVPLAKAFGGNAYEGIKALQVIELIVAWLSASYLYSRIRRDGMWAWVAGAFFALLPEQLLTVRSNVETGMICALTPLALGVSIALLRRWGSWALPLCGVLAAFASAYFSLAYSIFAGLPVFAFACAAAFDRRRPWLWGIMGVAGLAAGIGSAAYTLLPSYFSRGVFAPAFSIALLFGSGWPNVPSLRLDWIALLIAILLELVVWSLACGWAAWAIRGRRLDRMEFTLLIVGGICALLSFIFPQFSGVSTAVVAVAAAGALERLARTSRWRAAVAPLGLVALVCGVAAIFALRVYLGDAFSIQPIAAPQPQGRVAALDWQTPATPEIELARAPAPFLAFGRDISQRYASDGIGGLGLLGRANVATVVGSAALSSPSAPAPRGYVTSVNATCIGGGPGLLDLIAALPQLRDAAFFVGSFPCSRAIYLDSAPLDQLLAGVPVETFVGAALFPRARELIGYDDRVAPDTFFINSSWYREAIDGDTPDLSGAAVALNSGDQAGALFEAEAARYELGIHIVCHQLVRGHILRDATFTIPFTCAPHPGFQWLRIPFGKLSAGEHSYKLAIDSAAGPSIGHDADWSAALDAVVFLLGASPPSFSYDSAFAFSVDRLTERQWISAGAYRVTVFDARGNPAGGALRFDGRAAGTSVLVRRTGLHRIDWLGAPRSAAMVLLVPLSWRAGEALAQVSTESSMRWSIRVRHKSVIEAAVFADGYWFLEKHGGVALGGASCDLVNTCFGYVEPGRYELVHRWPGYVVLGFFVTLASWLFGGFALLYAWRRERTSFDIQELNEAWPATYFAYLGWLVVVVVSIGYVNWLRLGEFGWMLSRQLAAIALLTLAVLVVTAWQSGTRRAVDGEARHGLWLLWAAFAGVAACVAASVALDIADRRLFVLVIAAVQTCALVALNPSLSRRMVVWLGLGAACTWSLTSGLSFTHLADWLVNGDPSSGLATVAFVLSFGFVLWALRADETARATRKSNVIVGGLAASIFVAFALRTDGLGVEWIPLHRSIFADVSQFVRDGHWLLWDVPSLYGFLSMLALAIVPAVDSWQALFELTALFLVVQAGIACTILRWGRGGLANAAFAILFPLATIFNDAIARYPMSGRLYPQGGLRFFWEDALLFVIFLRYVWRDRPRRLSTLRWLGNGAWLASLLWSFEAGAWATALWIPYLLLETLTDGEDRGFWAAAWRCVRYFVPLAVLPVLCAFAVRWFYVTRLGHPPDWRGFVEFTALFTSGQVRSVFHVQHLGAGWILLLVLASTGALGIAAARERRWDLVRLLAGAWLATWATASYYAVEPLDMYVSLLLAVMVPACAIAIFASREGLRDRSTALIARYGLAPLAIVAIAIAFGEPSRIAAMRFPFTAGWTLDVKQDAPPISGELALLMQRAGIAPGDAVLVPNGGYWTEAQQGMIQPYERDSVGKIVAFRAWLPFSPVGPEILYNQLPPDRQHLYDDRFLDISRRGGWYVVYRQRERCESVSDHLRTIRTFASPNFTALLCDYKP